MKNSKTISWAAICLLFLVSLTASVGAGIEISPKGKVIRLVTDQSAQATLKISVTGSPADVTLEWANYSYTTLDSTKTEWKNFLGEEYFTLTVKRSSMETKSRDFLLVFRSHTKGVDDVTAVVSSSIVKHPYALFSDVRETPGYAYASLGREPYASWQNAILEDADDLYLDYSFCSSSENDAYQAYELAVSYQITGENKYADKAIEALECLDLQKYKGDRTEGDALLLYSLTYDLVAEYMIDNDAANYYPVRKKLSEMSQQCFAGIESHPNAHDKIILASGLGTSGIVLKDYEPDSGTGPLQWLDAGTTRLWSNDGGNPRPFIELYNNDEGLSELGAYKLYWIYDLVWWANVYQRNYGNLSGYTNAVNVLNEPLWLMLPSGRYDKGTPSQNTRDNSMALDLDYGYYVLGLIPEPERAIHKWVIEKYFGPGYEMNHPTKRTMQYLLYNDTIKSAAPDSRFKCSVSSESCILRSGWMSDSSYLFLKSSHYPIDSDRAMMHHDSMSFDYYDKGDYILIDSGEVKNRVEGYGPTDAKGHNTMMITDGPEGNAGGPVKGGASYTVFEDPAYVASAISSGFFDYAQAEITDWSLIERTNASGDFQQDYVRLSDPVDWKRSVMHPDNDYYVVMDYVKSGEERSYTNLFHLGSFSHTLTDGGAAGTVNGDLNIDGSPCDWKGQEYGSEVDAGESSSLTWDTVNIEGKRVETTLFAVPSSSLTVQKYWARIGTDRLEDEIDHPVIRFRTNATDLYRITAFDTRFLNETGKNYSELEVSGGKGKAIQIKGVGFEDTVSIRSGDVISAGRIMTDAHESFARIKDGSLDSFFVGEGKTFYYDGMQILSSANEITAALKYADGGVYGTVAGSGTHSFAVRILSGGCGKIASVELAGRKIGHTCSNGMVSLVLDGPGDINITLGADDPGSRPGDGLRGPFAPDVPLIPLVLVLLLIFGFLAVKRGRIFA